MKKYPYIGKGLLGSVVLFTDSSFGVAIRHENKEWEGVYRGGWNESIFTDVTHEYLSSTWGVVESKEHAEFIIELAELHGLKINYEKVEDCDPKCFMFYSSSVGIYHYNHLQLSNERGFKQITIPLPPKAKEWPQVGDEVVTQGGSKGILLVSKPDRDGMILCDFDGEYALAYLNELQKPKTKEDILTEELQTKLCDNNHVDNFTLASDVINGMIPGLSYNSVIERAVKGVINKNLDGEA